MTTLKPLIRINLHSLGGIKIFRARHKNGWRILTYHNFPADQSGLRRQCEHLVRFYKPISLTEVLLGLSKHELPENAVTVTIDDGYRDFLTNAYPVFSEFQIPTTVYLVSDFIDRQRWLWWDEIAYALEKTSEKSAALKIGNQELHIDLTSGTPQSTVLTTICEPLKLLADEERLSTIKNIRERLGVAMPGDWPSAYEPLSWDEVRRLSKGNVEFGAHTKTHPILSSIKDEERLKTEILGSKLRIEEELGCSVRHFCYPNGRDCDIGGEALRIVRASGFDTAVTTEAGMNYPKGHLNPMKLKRLGVDPAYPVYYFAELMAGVRSA